MVFKVNLHSRCFSQYFFLGGPYPSRRAKELLWILPTFTQNASKSVYITPSVKWLLDFFSKLSWDFHNSLALLALLPAWGSQGTAMGLEGSSWRSIQEQPALGKCTSDGADCIWQHPHPASLYSQASLTLSAYRIPRASMFQQKGNQVSSRADEVGGNTRQLSKLVRN